MDNAQRLQAIIDDLKSPSNCGDADLRGYFELVVALANIEITRHAAPTGAMATPSTLSRFAPALVRAPGHMSSLRGGMKPDDLGEWVALADALPILAALRNLYHVHADWNNTSKRAEALANAKRVLGL